MLQQIVAAKRVDVEQQKQAVPEPTLMVAKKQQPFRLQQRLRENACR